MITSYIVRSFLDQIYCYFYDCVYIDYCEQDDNCLHHLAPLLYAMTATVSTIPKTHKYGSGIFVDGLIHSCTS